MLALDILPFGPHFGVRLFVPGADKFAATLVMEQLTCSGVFEARAMVKDWDDDGEFKGNTSHHISIFWGFFQVQTHNIKPPLSNMLDMVLVYVTAFHVDLDAPGSQYLRVCNPILAYSDFIKILSLKFFGIHPIP